MTTIAFVSWKGGTGKTLLAANTAERAVNNGLSALLCDFDPQATALRHCAVRQAQHPDATPIPAVRGAISAEGHQALANLAASQRYDLLICDLPGADSYVMDLVLESVDHLLIPMMAAPYEIMVTASLVNQGRERGWPMVLVPNNLPPHTRRAEQLVQSIRSLDVPVAPVNIVRRVDYWDASAQGLGVCEYSPKSKAATEIGQLWRWISQELLHPKALQGELNHA